MSRLVSVCVPTFNGSRWLREAIVSALSQTYVDLEVLIVDDKSTDSTLDTARSFSDSRIRIEVNSRNLGIVGNRNRCIELSKGPYIKFLFQDDILYPSCIEKMVQTLEDNENVGMAFAPRDILIENPADPYQVGFRSHHARSYENFGTLRDVNRGIELFTTWLSNNFSENWVGEPSSVMLRKKSIQDVGLFNTKMQSCSDMEMWIRMMYFYDVAFINEPLSTFRYHTCSAGARIREKNLYWLDRLWLLEGLLEHEEIERDYQQIQRLRDIEAEAIRKSVLRRQDTRTPSLLYRIKSYAEYRHYCFRRLIHNAPSLHGSVKKTDH